MANVAIKNHLLESHFANLHSGEDLIFLDSLRYFDDSLKFHLFDICLLPGIHEIEDDGQDIVGLRKVDHFFLIHRNVGTRKGVGVSFEIPTVKREVYIVRRLEGNICAFGRLDYGE